ncbi:interaptin isoform X2 [Sparus aurata]|uniref:interaptin isoform X2 n=1 Tax=Sparus aurata TaxID=8175 RepID=UPI0011C152B5|nr:interaptin-like isoform X2 [Sparus aurata]
MAGSSYFIRIPLLLCCVFQASGNRNVRQVVASLPSQSGSTESPAASTCTGVKDQLTRLSSQLQQATLHNSQLDNEAFGLRREVRQLKLQLDMCSLTASTITGSYQTQLLNKMKQHLETFDSDTFLVLKTIALTSEVNALQKKVKHAANSTESATDITMLQRELQEKTNDMNAKMQQIERSHPNAALILQIISLQNQIWDLEQETSRRGETSLQPDRSILALQAQLDGKISQLRENGDAVSDTLELISVHSKIATMQRLISIHIKESRTNAAEYQRQWRQKGDLLKKKILQLNREERNTTLTREILKLQSEVEGFHLLMVNAKRITESQLSEIKVILEEEKRRLEYLQKQLEGTEYAQSQLIMTVINQMKELRTLQVDEQVQTTPTSPATALQTLLQTKENEFARAQAEISELQRKLLAKSGECSGPEERYEHVRTEFEQKVKELNGTGNSEAALILNVISLHDELRTLRELIATADDPDRITELTRQLEEKQEDLNSKTADIETLVANPRIILTIIELQEQISDLQKRGASDTNGLQNRVDDLLAGIDDRQNTKLMLKMISLQSQVEQLQKQLAGVQMLQTPQATKLRNDLTSKRAELQKCVNDLKEKNQRDARMILTATELHNQVKKLAKEKQNKSETTSATVTKLREQLQEKVEELARDRAEINDLRNQLNQTEGQCSDFEEKLKDLQSDLDGKIVELQSKSDTVTSLALQVSTLTLQIEELKRQQKSSESDTKIKELQKVIDAKTNELTRKTEELKARSAQPQRLLQIITLQTEIDKLANVAANDTDYIKMRGLQDLMNDLIAGIQDENNENTKLMFQILAQQDEIARLKKQAESQNQAELEKIKDLENELEDVRHQIQEKTLVLDSSDTRIANLTAQIMELHQKIKPLEDEISELKEANTENLEELQKRLSLTNRQLQDSELRLREADGKNFNSIMEIADLRTKLKKAQKLANKAAKQNVDELEQQIQTQQRENKKLANTNKDLQQEVTELRTCCSNVNSQCDDLETQLQQSQEDADRLQQKLHEKDAKLKQLQQDLEEQIRVNNNLQSQNKFQKQQKQTPNITKEILPTDVEDNTIYAKKMTFDSNTANPRVALSADYSEMSTSEELQNVPDHPGRFNVLLAALGRTGFSTGNHYWEVSVADKNCFHLGMASESAPRRGSVSFRPANGFWTIVLNKNGQYKAIDRQHITLRVERRPLTLGILLEYKKGQVSFYDADTRSHIYSFVGQRFTDKIYPFVNLCVEDVGGPTPIVLITPGSVDWIN